MLSYTHHYWHRSLCERCNVPIFVGMGSNFIVAKRLLAMLLKRCRMSYDWQGRPSVSISGILSIDLLPVHSHALLIPRWLPEFVVVISQEGLTYWPFSDWFEVQQVSMIITLNILHNLTPSVDAINNSGLLASRSLFLDPIPSPRSSWPIFQLLAL